MTGTKLDYITKEEQRLFVRAPSKVADQIAKDAESRKRKPKHATKEARDGR